jgi:hypothetical protein
LLIDLDLNSAPLAALHAPAPFVVRSAEPRAEEAAPANERGSQGA